MATLRDALAFLTPQVFDWLVLLVVLAGLALAGRRLRADLRRPAGDDTRPLQE